MCVYVAARHFDINTNVPLLLSFSPSLLLSFSPPPRYDNDVSVFGKILRNEIDEDFRHVQVNWFILYMIMVNMACLYG